MPLKYFAFPPDIVMYLPEDWFDRDDPPIELGACREEVFSLPVHPAQPDFVDDRLTCFLRDLPMTADARVHLAIAVSELVMNIAQQTPKFTDQRFGVHFMYVAPLYVMVGITDSCGALPTTALEQNPTTPAALAALANHGRGFYIIRQLVHMLGHVAGPGTEKELLVGINLQPLEVSHAR
ncbi:MAG: ATP-binding protein [Patescibacteria group bacterium]